VSSKGTQRHNLPFADDTAVKVIVIPKINLEKMSFAKIQSLTQSIHGNLSEDIIRERHCQ
jgi:hypothetical protein